MVTQRNGLMGRRGAVWEVQATDRLLDVVETNRWTAVQDVVVNDGRKTKTHIHETLE
jgi:hypothetical protein